MLMETWQEQARTKIDDICNRLLSGQFQQDGLCRLLALRNDLNTSEPMKASLNRAYEMATAGNTRRAVEELRKWIL